MVDDYITGWWLVYVPLWKKYELVNVGMMTFPTEWKNMFKTTSQYR